MKVISILVFSYVAHIEENSPLGSALLFGNPYITEISDDELVSITIWKNITNC